MAERQIQFSLESERFQATLNNFSNGFSLQHEFKTKGVSLSQSLLIWRGEPRTWLLADFESERMYDIEEVGDTAENQRVEVSEQSTEAEQPVTLTGTAAILSRLQSVYQGTDPGQSHIKK